jgi:Flp pilus assembly protein TadG
MSFRRANVSQSSESGKSHGRGFLRRLVRSKGGNVLAMMAIGIIPLAGLIGGAVDMSRLYLTKTRLQQACDAGALAGRKVMGGGTWAANSNAANTSALEFFDSNFKSGSYGTLNRTRAFTESQGKVTGTATAQVPMTIMKVFNKPTQTLSVTCDAEMRLPNTDVMFVLDTTYSMTETIPGDTSTKIVGLKRAVKCFYEILEKLDTTEVCPTGTPSGGVGNQVQLRFGFMPYASNVNVGKLLPTSYIADNWTYSTRQAHLTLQNISVATYNTGSYVAGSPGSANVTAPGTYGSWANNGSQWNNGSSNCPGAASNDYSWSGSMGAAYNQTGPTTSGNNQVYTNQKDETGTENDYQNVQSGSSPNKLCQPQKRTRPVTRTRTYTRTDTPATWNTGMRPNGTWDYGEYSLDVSGLKNGSAWNASVQIPTGSLSGWTINNDTATWDGCIEERATTANLTNYSSLLTGNFDLNIDLAPASGANQWGAMLRDATYIRSKTSSTGGSLNSTNPVNSASDYMNPSTGVLGDYSCPTEARKLAAWTTPSVFEAYVNSLTPASYTYHDIGLLWGARFMSPTGIFASENALTSQGGEIERHLIFMTDGQACTKSDILQAYGVAYYRHKTTTSDVTDTSFRCSTDTDGGGPLTAQVVGRYEALCSAVKNKNITVWVIYFGDVSADDRDRMEDCATDTRFYEATDSASLLTTFSTIAAQIANLRLTS